MIYLLRHGNAEEGNGDDAARRLTSKGERQARDAGLALAALEVSIASCLTSPKRRAAETASRACEALRIEPETAPELSGGAFDSRSLAAGLGDVLLVGHEPDLSDELARLTGARAQMRKGGLAIVDGSTLVGLLGPAELRQIAS